MILLKRIKILVVADSGSIHAARFINLLQELRYRVKIFHTEFCYRQDEHLKKIAINVPFPYNEAQNNNKLEGFSPFVGRIATVLQSNPKIYQIFYKFINKHLNKYRPSRAKQLVRAIVEYKPDLVISLKMQNDGYEVSQAKTILGSNFLPKWLHFSWGSDIEYFAKNPRVRREHILKIKKVLENCDYFLADCMRDVNQVKKFGLQGKNLGMMIANGGFNLNEIKKIRLHSKSERNIILIKGREDKMGGRAFNVFRALRPLASDLKKYQVKIIYYNLDIKDKIDFLRKRDGIKYELVPWLPYKKILELFAKSLITISATEIEGTPSFLLESIVLGALPIHSDIETIRDWITDGKNGLLFPVDDIGGLTKCLKIALHDHNFVTKAREINWKITQKKIDRNIIRKNLKKIIEKEILNDKKIS